MRLLLETNPNVHHAASFAEVIHKGQTYSQYPYTYHLERTYNVLRRFNYRDETILISAILHDSIEDTLQTKESIAEKFGSEVANLVWLVTDEDILDRRARKLATYPKIASDYRAVAIKLADRIANVECSLEENSRYYEMYVKEYTDFFGNLYSPGDHARHLDLLMGKLT